MAANVPQAEQARELAATMRRLVGWAMAGTFMVAALATIDLVVGSPIGDRRLDMLLLAGALLGLVGEIALLRLAGRTERGEADATKRTSIRPVEAAALSMATVASLLVSAAIGYMLGGWVTAIGLPALCVAVVSGMWVITRRRAEER